MGKKSSKDSFKLEDVLAQAEKKKGSKLTPKEIALFQENVSEVERLERELEQLEAKEAEKEALRLEELARQIIQNEIEMAKKEPKSEARAKAIFAERIEIKRQLVKLGYKLNDTPDISDEKASE